jgi:CHASE3 domain sensor protein
MFVPDVKRLAAEISVQHGIRVDPDDPMMAVVTLNRMVLEQAVGEIVERLQGATRDFQDATEKVQLRAGTRLAREVRDAANALREELVEAGRLRAHDVTTEMSRANAKPVARWALAVGVVVGILLFLSGFWLGIGTRAI